MSVRRRAAPGAVDALRAELARAAVDARAYAAAPVGIFVPNTEEKTIPMDKTLQNVPGDGSCLYHALYQLYDQSTWLVHDGRPRPEGKTTQSTWMRDKIATWFVRNGARYEGSHREEVLKWGYWMQKVFQRDWLKNEELLKQKQDSWAGEDVPFDFLYNDAIEHYAKHIRTPPFWGGDLEIDVAAEMFGVIIHQYVESNGQRSLHSSFYPRGEDDDNDATLTRWFLVLVDSLTHYNYIPPVPPTAASAPKRDPPPPVPTAPDPTSPTSKRAAGDSCPRAAARPLNEEEDEMWKRAEAGRRMMLKDAVPSVSPPADGDRWRPWKWRWW